MGCCGNDENIYKRFLAKGGMERGESSGSDDNIVIVKVTGKTSKTITIPDTVCEFLDIDFGDILKLRIQDKRKGKKRK